MTDHLKEEPACHHCGYPRVGSFCGRCGKPNKIINFKLLTQLAPTLCFCQTCGTKYSLPPNPLPTFNPYICPNCGSNKVQKG